MKKLLLTTMIAALLIVPLNGVALAQTQESLLPPVSDHVQSDFVPGDAPAQSQRLEAMSPALHAVLLAMLSNQQTAFTPANTTTAWETLYNMLSLYGQLDERSEYLGEQLLLPVETVMDFSAALFPDFAALGTLPKSLSDRIVYDSEIDSYLVTCGNDSLSEIRITNVVNQNGTLTISGALVYLVDDTNLAQFTATLLPQDNMFGYIVSAMTLVA